MGTLFDFGESYSAYVSPYFVETNNGYTKHYYAGATRLVSKIGEGVYKDSTYISYGEEERDQYFYFQDHLGSSTYITTLTGEVAQYAAYTPYGELFREYRNVTPYKFNGKELDAETGLYYYGARYYNPATALWLGVDPLASKYPGVSPYVYCISNPVKYVDPDGKIVTVKISSKAIGTTYINLFSFGEVKNGTKQELMEVNVYTFTVSNESGRESTFYFTRVGYRKDAKNPNKEAEEVTFDVKNDGDIFLGVVKSRWDGENNVLELRDKNNINSQSIDARKGRTEQIRKAIQCHIKGATDGCMMSVGKNQFRTLDIDIDPNYPTTSKGVQEAFMNDIMNYRIEDKNNGYNDAIYIQVEQLYKDEN